MWIVTATTLGAACFVMALWAIWRKKLPRVSVFLALIAGLTVAGLIGGFGDKAGSVLTQASASLSTKAFGVAIAALVGLILLLEFLYAAHPKKGRPHRWVHAVIAFIIPSVFVAIGGPFAVAAGWGTSGVQQVAVVATSFWSAVK